MNLFVLDTDHVSLHQRGHPQVAQRIAATSPDSLAVTIVTLEEQIRGRFDVIRKHTASPLQVRAYFWLRESFDYFKAFQILDFDEAAYLRYEALRKQKLRVGSQDLRIAAIALSVGATVVTRNQRDFAQVPGLTVQDWSTA